MANTTLLMQDFLPVRHSLSYIVVSGIILQNGVVQKPGIFFFPAWKLLSEIYNRPVNKYELFNLRHSSARNVIERIFGVLKRRFRILQLAPEYSLDIQARIPTALCAIHNFICVHDAKESEELVTHAHDGPGHGGNYYREDDDSFGPGLVDPEVDADVRRDEIAQKMWDDYQRISAERAAEHGSGETDDEETDDEETDDEETDDEETDEEDF